MLDPFYQWLVHKLFCIYKNHISNEVTFDSTCESSFYTEHWVFTFIFYLCLYKERGQVKESRLKVRDEEQDLSRSSFQQQTRQFRSLIDIQKPLAWYPQYRSYPNLDDDSNMLQSNRTKKWEQLFIYHKSAHIVDRKAKIIFPVAFFIVNTIYFLFHIIQPGAKIT